MAADDEINVKLTVDTDNLEQGLEDAGKAVGEAGEGMEEGFGNIGESLDEIKEKFNTAFEITGLAAAYEAVEKLVDLMGELSEKAEHLEQTAFLYDTNTDALQGLYHAAVAAGVGTETMDRGLRVLEMRLQSAREGSTEMQDKLEAVGITMKDLHDPTFNAAEAMQRMAETEATHGEQMAVLGPRAIQVALAFEKLKGGTEEANQAAKDNGALTEEQIGILSQYHSEVSVLKEGFENFEMMLAAKVAPILETVIDNFKLMFSSMEDKDGVMALLQYAFEGFFNTLTRVVGLIKYFSDAIIGAFELIGSVVGGIVAIMTSDLGDLGNTVQVVMEGVTETFNRAANQMNVDAQNTVTALAQLQTAFDGMKDFGILNDNTDWDGNPIKKEKPTKDPFKPAKDKDDPALKALDFELGEAKKGSDQKIAIAETYQKYVDRMYEDDLGKQIEAMKKVLDAKKEQTEKLKELEEESMKNSREVQDKGIEDSIKMLETANKDKKLSTDDLLKDEIALYQQKLAIDDAYYAKLEELDADDAKKLMTDQNAQLANQQKIAQQIIEAQTKAAEETQKKWDEALKPIESAFNTMIKNIINGTDTLKSGLKKLMDSIVSDIFDKSIQEMTKNWLQGLQQQLIASRMTDQEKAASSQAAALQSKAATADQAKGEIQANSIVAGSAAYKAIVGIPYVGPVLAIAAMAAAEALVMGLIGKIASAEGGMVVDHDQMAMVHEDEMILPSHISQGINEKILNAPEQSTSGSTNHYSVNAMDAKSFEGYLNDQRNRNAVAKAINKAHKRGNRNVRMS